MVCWRSNLAGRLFVASILSCIPFSEQLDAQDRVQIEWRVPRENVSVLREDLVFDGQITPDPATAQDTKGLPLIYVFVGLVALPDLVTGITNAVREVACGGAVIELDGEGLSIRCEPALGLNTVVVRDADGVDIKQFDQTNDPSRLLQALEDLRGAM